MAKFKSPKTVKDKAPSKQGAVPCLILIAVLFALLALLFYAAVHGT